tara:strand:+ start:636 stop:872 length:237 start_codon:yes stop_codon:yes gene_type:complete
MPFDRSRHAFPPELLSEMFDVYYKVTGEAVIVGLGNSNYVFGFLRQKRGVMQNDEFRIVTTREREHGKPLSQDGSIIP